jgi:hypothetical protein
MNINEFAEVVLTQQRERLARLYSQDHADNERVTVIPGRVYTKVDVGTKGFRDETKASCGKFMVENATGIIYGIKGYGKVHKGHVYGTLDTVADWYWGDYSPEKR